MDASLNGRKLVRRITTMEALHRTITPLKSSLLLIIPRYYWQGEKMAHAEATHLH
jgi:hypothetical protein